MDNPDNYVLLAIGKYEDLEEAGAEPLADDTRVSELNYDLQGEIDLLKQQGNAAWAGILERMGRIRKELKPGLRGHVALVLYQNKGGIGDMLARLSATTVDTGQARACAQAADALGFDMQSFDNRVRRYQRAVEKRHEDLQAMALS